jgi:hypothetical protein
VNETKTRVCKLPEEKFDFLGYTFGRCYSSKTGRAYLGTVPSKKRIIRICEAISEMTGRDQTLLDQEMVVANLNRTMVGWANYFCLGPIPSMHPSSRAMSFGILVVLPCLLLESPRRQGQTSAPKLAAFHVDGQKRYSESHVVVATALQIGQVLDQTSPH